MGAMTEAQRWREARTIYGRADLPKVVKAGDALAAALEARDRELDFARDRVEELAMRIEELEAGMMRIADDTEDPATRWLANDLLINR